MTEPGSTGPTDDNQSVPQPSGPIGDGAAERSAVKPKRKKRPKGGKRRRARGRPATRGGKRAHPTGSQAGAEPAQPASPDLDREALRQRDQERKRAEGRDRRDVSRHYRGPGDLKRRRACRENLSLFLRTYFPRSFPWPWSPDHIRIIERLETCIVKGGLFALAMPRGGGKTTICMRAVLWAMLYGYRRFATLVGATEKHAVSLIKGIKTELLFNELLAEDFQDSICCIRALDNETRRAQSQLFDGRVTMIEWGADQVGFPIVPDRLYRECGSYFEAKDGEDIEEWQDVGGSVIRVAALTGAIRGPQKTLPSGTILRPDLVILDDPQTRESARSVEQTKVRSDIINGDVKFLAGPGQKIAIAMPCTVIQEGDLADTYLDRKKHPEWTGVKTKLLTTLPVNEKLWEEYAKIRNVELENGRDISAATAFYRQHQAEMDAGADASWAERHNNDEISAIQHAMNLKIEDPDSFFAEYQNEPRRAEEGETIAVQSDLIQRKLHGFARGAVPLTAQWLTGMIDVQDHALYWMVAAWASDFTGWIVDYGCWPEQKTAYYVYSKLQNKLGRQYPNHGREGAILAGLNELSAKLIERQWLRLDATVMRLDRLLVDSGHEMDLVFNFCRASRYGSVLMPSRGVGITAAHKPMTDYDTKNGDRVGHNWVIPRADKRHLRTLRYDTNYWKSFLHKHFAVALGDPGSLSLFGREPGLHRMVAEQLTAEEPVKTFGQGREVWQWKLLVGRDNHLLDTAVGCAAAASMLGASMAGLRGHKRQARARVSLAELKARAQRAGVRR